MTKTLQDKINALPEKRHDKILHRANELIQEEQQKQAVFTNAFGLLKDKLIEGSVQWQKNIRDEWD